MVFLLLKEFLKSARRAVRCEPDGEIQARFPGEAQNATPDIDLEALGRPPLQLVYDRNYV
jgi:hypothetical protein